MASLYNVGWMRKGISGVVREKLKVFESSRMTQEVTAAEVVEVARRAAGGSSSLPRHTSHWFIFLMSH